MTAEQFTWWVQGFLDAKPYSSDVAEKIQEKLKEVKHEAKGTTSNNHYWYPNYQQPQRVNLPYTWCSNEVKMPEVSEMTVIC